MMQLDLSKEVKPKIIVVRVNKPVKCSVEVEESRVERSETKRFLSSDFAAKLGDF